MAVIDYKANLEKSEVTSVVFDGVAQTQSAINTEQVKEWLSTLLKSIDLGYANSLIGDFKIGKTAQTDGQVEFEVILTFDGAFKTKLLNEISRRDPDLRQKGTVSVRTALGSFEAFAKIIYPDDSIRKEWIDNLFTTLEVDGAFNDMLAIQEPDIKVTDVQYNGNGEFIGKRIDSGAEDKFKDELKVAKDALSNEDVNSIIDVVVSEGPFVDLDKVTSSHEIEISKAYIAGRIKEVCSNFNIELPDRAVEIFAPSYWDDTIVAIHFPYKFKEDLIKKIASEIVLGSGDLYRISNMPPYKLTFKAKHIKFESANKRPEAVEEDQYKSPNRKHTRQQSMFRSSFMPSKSFGGIS